MKSNKITIIVIIIVLIAGGYWFFFAGNGGQAPLTASGPSAETTAQTQFQALVTELQPITFDTSIFSDPKFTSLTNLATPVVPEPSGRLDPFAAISGVTGS